MQHFRKRSRIKPGMTGNSKALTPLSTLHIPHSHLKLITHPFYKNAAQRTGTLYSALCTLHCASRHLPSYLFPHISYLLHGMGKREMGALGLMRLCTLHSLLCTVFTGMGAFSLSVIPDFGEMVVFRVLTMMWGAGIMFQSLHGVL